MEPPEADLRRDGVLGSDGGEFSEIPLISAHFRSFEFGLGWNVGENGGGLAVFGGDIAGFGGQMSGFGGAMSAVFAVFGRGHWMTRGLGGGWIWATGLMVRMSEALGQGVKCHACAPSLG